MNPPSGARRLISVYEDDDFQAIHCKPECDVRCPRDDCGSRLTAKTNRNGTRWLAARPGEKACHHHEVPLKPKPTITSQGGGGEETPEHLWIKARIARVCTVVGLDAFIEHQPTRADVFVPGPDLALEYQRWDTKFAPRNLARKIVGAKQTLWFFPRPPKTTSRSTQSVLAEIFNTRVYKHGGLFLKPAHKDDPTRMQKPWEHPEDREMNKTTWLYVSGSVVTYDAEHAALRYAGAYGLHLFIDQVAKGERTLQDVDVRLKNGTTERKLVWVRHSDLAKVAEEREKREQARAAALAEERARQAQDTPPSLPGAMTPVTPPVQATSPAADNATIAPRPALPARSMAPRPAFTATQPPAGKQSLWRRLRHWLSGR